MSPDDREKLEEQYREIVRLYPEVKRLVAVCEQTDADQRAPIAAVSELRSALDHIMRAHRVLYGFVDEQVLEDAKSMSAPDYCRINIDKALGHLYRAGYDAYDLLCLRANQVIETMLNGRARDALYAVVPDFAQLQTDLNALRQTTLAGLKVDKDVESSNEERSVYGRYQNALGQLTAIHDALHDHMPRVLDYEREARRRTGYGVVVQVVIAVAALLAGAAVSYFLLLPK